MLIVYYRKGIICWDHLLRLSEKISFITVYMIIDLRHEWRMPFRVSDLIEIKTGILDLFSQYFYCDQYQQHLLKHRNVAYKYSPKELQNLYF